MKTKIASILFIVGASLQGQTLLTDDFTGTTINTSKWSTILPQNGASVVQSNNSVTTSTRGILASVGQFTGQIIISGTVTMLSPIEHFNIAFRTDLSGQNGNAAADRSGVFVSFSNDGKQISIQQTGANTTVNLPVASYPFVTGKPYSFTITDTGSVITLSINGVQQITGTTSYRIGNNIAFYSRELSGCSTRIDGISVSVLPTVQPTVITVPDTSSHLVNLSTLGNGGFSMGFVISGSTSKNVLVRGVGPTLKTFGITNAAQQTSITLYSGSTAIGSNTGWSTAPNVTQIIGFGGAFPLTGGSADSVILTSLTPGSYTAQVTAPSGAVLLEVYEVP